jgi:hypothetical protein
MGGGLPVWSIGAAKTWLVRRLDGVELRARAVHEEVVCGAEL